MSQLTIEKNTFLTDFADFAAGRTDEPPFVASLRSEALTQFATAGLPHRRLEKWRQLDLSGFRSHEFALIEKPPAVLAHAIAPLRLAGAQELVFVDGHFVPELSEAGSVAGVQAGSLAVAARQQPTPLGRDVDLSEPFAALNTIYWQDGAFVQLQPGAVAQRPLHLLCVATGGEQPTVSYPRHLIALGANSEATVIETYTSLGAGVHFSCPLSEVGLAANARLNHHRFVRQNPAAYHLATSHLHLGRDSRINALAACLGGSLTRHDLHVDLAAPGSEANLQGLYLAADTQQVDNHLWVRHSAPHTRSRQSYRGILAGRAQAVFNGNIHVEAAAAKTDARQSNRNLLLSDTALVHTNPQLEIYAGDVRCTHGSTVGQLDEEALFYLRSRGLDAASARNLLTYAFASDLIDAVEPAILRPQLEQALFDWLSLNVGFRGETR